MARILPSLATLLLCSTALAGCDTLGVTSSSTPASDKAAMEKHVHEAPPTDVAGGVRQAHDLRLAGNYDDATRILSQMMLVASDDPRVVGEYGKTLLQRGRTQDAVQFLSRAVQLDATDWSTYSALGVADDQLGDQRSARDAYEHALSLQPNEASVLSNYALSRMLANDLPAARLLAARAQKAGGDADPKIARNIAMIAATAPAQPVAMAPSPVAPTLASAAPAPAPVPVQKVAAADAPVHIVPATGPVPTSAPRVLMPASASNTLPAGTQPYSGVVMQAVPFDPLAGPVKRPANAGPAKSVASAATVQNSVKAPAKSAWSKHTVKPTHAPQAVAKAATTADEAKAAGKNETAGSDIAKTQTVTTGVEKTVASTPAKPAADKAQSVAVKTSAPVKAAAVTTPVKPAADKASETVKAAAAATPVKAVAVTTPVKPVADKTSETVKAAAAAAPVKAVAVTAPVKPVADKTSETVKAAAAATPVKAAAVTAPAKPGADKAAPVKVAAAVPVKGVADKTPAAVKAVASKQDGVPALRLAADASTP